MICCNINNGWNCIGDTIDDCMIKNLYGWWKFGIVCDTLYTHTTQQPTTTAFIIFIMIWNGIVFNAELTAKLTVKILGV